MERDSKMRVTVCMLGEPVLISEMLAGNRTVSSMEIQPDGQMPSDKTIRAGNIFFWGTGAGGPGFIYHFRCFIAIRSPASQTSSTVAEP